MVRKKGDLTAEEEKIIIAEKEAAIAEKEAAIAEKEAIMAEKEAAITEKEAAVAEKEAIMAEKEAIMAEKEIAINEKKVAINEKKVAISEKRAAISEKEVAMIEKEAAISLAEEAEARANALTEEKAKLEEDLKLANAAYDMMADEFESCFDMWDQADQEIRELKKEIAENDRKFGSMSKEEEYRLIDKKNALEKQLAEVESKKVQAEESLIKWQKDYENLSVANVTLNQKLADKLNQISQMEAEDKEEDEAFRNIISSLKNDYWDMAAKLTTTELEKVKIENKIREQAKELDALKTPEHYTKLGFAVHALQIIDPAKGDYYDLIANKVVTFKLMRDCKSVKDFFKALKLLKKACKAERKMLRKIKWGTFLNSSI